MRIYVGRPSKRVECFADNRASLPSIRKKPLSLTVHEIAVPVLKALAVVLGLVAGACLILPLVIFPAAVNEFFPLFIMAIGILNLLPMGAWVGAKNLAQSVKNLEKPEWAAYYSQKLKNAPLEQVLKEIPDTSVWIRLKWSGEAWKEKVLPYARAHQMERKALQSQFKGVFENFDPLLRDYYRETDLPLLQKEGYQVFREKTAGFSLTLTNEEIREKILQETAGMDFNEIYKLFQPFDPFDVGYLMVEEFVDRFNRETDGLNLEEISKKYPTPFLAKGLLTADRLASLMDRSIEAHPGWNYQDVERRYIGLDLHNAWFKSPQLQKLFISKISDPDFRFSKATVFLTPENMAYLPPEWAKLIGELNREKARILAKSKEHAETISLYEKAPSTTTETIVTSYDRWGNPEYCETRTCPNPCKEYLEKELRCWERADHLYQERMLPELDQKAREKIAALSKRF